MADRATAPSRCVGRDVELTRLFELYRETVREGERLVLVRGESGVGKSRILSEFRGRIRLEGGVVLEGRCEPGRAFGPFAEIVDHALRFLEEVGEATGIVRSDLACREGCHRFWYQHDDADPNADANGGPPREALERRLRFFDAIEGLLRDVSRVRAPVVMFHELERADQGTLQLLEALLSSSGPWTTEGGEPSLRVLLVASLRSDTAAVDGALLTNLIGHARATVLEVGALGESGVRAYLQAPESIARIMERTGGIPEAIDLLLEADPLTPEAHLSRLLSTLSPSARSLIEALSVVARPTDLPTLARIAEEEADQEAENQLTRSELVARSIVDGHMLFSFSRERTRERTYELLAPARRRALHSRCAELFAQHRGRMQDAAMHAVRAGDLSKAVPMALEAAHVLAARHAHGEAAAVLEHIAEASPERLPSEVAEYLGDLYRVAGDYRSALGHAEAVRAERPDSAHAARRVGDLLTLAGELDEAARVLEEAHRLATQSDDPIIKLDVETLLAELQYQRGYYPEAREWAERALSAAEELGALPLEIHARNTLGKLAIVLQDVRTAEKLFRVNRDQSREGDLGHEEAQALTNIGVAKLRRQDLAGAEEAFSAAVEVSRRANETRDVAIAIENLAVMAHLGRDYARAIEHYHEAVGLLKRLGNRAMLTRVANNLGELYLSLGDRRRALALCDFATHMGGTGLPPSVTGEGLLLRGRVEAARAQNGAAHAAFEAALRTFERIGHSGVADAWFEIGRIALSEGDVERAREALQELPPSDSPKRNAEVALLAADVERAAGGKPLPAAQRAAEFAEEAGDDERLLPALIRLARAHCDEGDLALAASVLERAQQAEERLTAKVPEEAFDSWTARQERVELVAVEGQIAAAWSSAGRETAPTQRSRLSTLPPPPPRFREEDMERWRTRYPDLVGSSPPIQSVLTVLDKVAPTDALVLIRGESGTGKELVAEALHRHSPRNGKPLVKVNCAALVETLLLSELFGHERGAFTGANSRKKGRFEMANGGTLFLDEIGDISPKTQVALLRVLQEREFERVGGTQPIHVDVRIIAATHRDLEAMVRAGEFREDLYYRLKGVMLEMPPLRRRYQDLPELSEHLLRRIAEERGDRQKSISPEAIELLSTHAWPGNVRELENVLRSATLFAESEALTPTDFAAFADTFQEPRPSEPPPAGDNGVDPESRISLEDQIYERIRDGDNSLLELKKELERECIVRALTETGGNITRAAALLGMKRPRLSQLVKQHGLAVEK